MKKNVLGMSPKNLKKNHKKNIEINQMSLNQKQKVSTRYISKYFIL